MWTSSSLDQEYRGAPQAHPPPPGAGGGRSGTLPFITHEAQGGGATQSDHNALQ